MRTPSRQMPAYAVNPRSAPGAYGILVVVLAGFIGAGIVAPVILAYIATVFLFVVAASFFDRTDTYLCVLQEQRRGESICSFARAADCRKNDSWIVRAVYEQTKAWLPRNHTDLPLRWTDRFVEDLRIDGEDAEDIAEEVAQRAGYSLDDCSANPLNGKVSTLGDLVLFMMQQPRCPGAVR